MNGVGVIPAGGGMNGVGVISAGGGMNGVGVIPAGDGMNGVGVIPARGNGPSISEWIKGPLVTQLSTLR